MVVRVNLFLGIWKMKETLPGHFTRFIEDYPAVWQAHQEMAQACAESGPMGRKTRELIKVAISGAANMETALERHAVMAIQEGATPDEVYQAVMLLVTSVGFPRASAAMKWAQRAIETS